MKLRKILLGTLFTSFYAICSCKSIGEPNKYYLTVENVARDFVDPPKSGYYRAGEKIKFSVDRLCDAQVYDFLNEEIIDEDDCNDYKPLRYFSFKMPEKDSVLTCTLDRAYYQKEWNLYSFYLSSDIYFNDDESLRCTQPIDYLYVANLRNTAIEDMIEIRETTCSRGIGEINTVTTDSRDFEYNVNALFSETLVRAPEYASTEEVTISYFEYTFHGNGKNLTFSFDLIDGMYVYANLGYFKFQNGSDGAPKIQYPVDKSASN